MQTNEASKPQHLDKRLVLSKLNLTEGVSGTLTTQIVEYITREDARNGTNANENTKKRMETAQAAMDQHKRMTAGLHFAVGNTSLGPTLLAHMRETPRSRQQIVRNQKKRKQMNGMLQSKPMFSKEEEVESLLKIAPMPNESKAVLNQHFNPNCLRWIK